MEGGDKMETVYSNPFSFAAINPIAASIVSAPLEPHFRETIQNFPRESRASSGAAGPSSIKKRLRVRASRDPCRIIGKFRRKNGQIMQCYRLFGSREMGV